MSFHFGFVFSIIEPTGGDKIVYEHVQLLLEAGHRITIHTLGFMDTASTLKKLYHNLRDRYLSLKIKFYNSDLKLTDEDLIVATGLGSANIVKNINKKFKKTWLVQNFDPYVFGKKKEIDEVYEYFDTFIIYSHHLAKIIQYYYGYKIFFFIPTGIDFHDLSNYRKSSFIGDKRVFFSFVYNRKYKGVNFANEVFKKLVNKGFTTVSMTVVGPSLPYSQEHHICPTHEEKYSCMASCDFCLHPSIFETWSLVTMESMGLGSVVVGTNSLGVKEYANNDNSCFFDSRDPDIIVKKIEELNNNKTEYLRLQHNALETARKYDWKNISNDIIGGYINAIN